MKKLFYIPAVLAFAVFAACGPSAAEKAKETARIDSLRNDSILKVEAAAAQAKAEEEQKVQAANDSIAKAKVAADSLAAAAAKPAKRK